MSEPELTEVTLAVTFRIAAQPGPAQGRLQEVGAADVARAALFGGDGDMSRRDGFADLPANALVAYLTDVEEM